MVKKLYIDTTNFLHFLLFIFGITLFTSSSTVLFYAIKRILVDGSFSNYGASGSQLQIEVLRQGFAILFCIGLVIISILLMIFSKNGYRNSIKEELKSKINSDLTRSEVIKLIAKNTTERLKLDGVNLSGVDLSGLFLQNVSLEYANLHKANLTGANLTGAYLWAANLTEANLHGTNLTKADLTAANLTAANLFKANLREAILYAADLRETNLYEANLSGVDLSDTDFSKATGYTK